MVVVSEEREVFMVKRKRKRKREGKSVRSCGDRDRGEKVM